MQFLKFTATATDKEWIEGNRDRQTYLEHKEEICDRTESRNEGRDDFFFLTEIRGERIKGAAPRRNCAPYLKRRGWNRTSATGVTPATRWNRRR